MYKLDRSSVFGKRLNKKVYFLGSDCELKRAECARCELKFEANVCEEGRESEN